MRKNQIIALVAVVFILTAVFLCPQSLSDRWKDQTLTLVSPFFKGIGWVRFQFRSINEDLKNTDQIKQDNLRLQAENAQLRAENGTFRNLEQENQELKSALKFQRSTSFRLLVARIIAREPSSWWQHVTIDRGTEDGISLDQAVVSTKGLIGKITAVTPGTSKVVLLGDENCRISATLEGTNEQGIILGHPTEMGTVQLKMTFISRTANLEIGQKVYTSGMGGVFPPGLLIGEVVELVPANESGGFGLYREVLVRPLAELSNLQDVFVVLGKK